FGIAPFHIGDGEWANWPLRRSGRSNLGFAYVVVSCIHASEPLWRYTNCGPILWLLGESGNIEAGA
ncbi:uncharacterized protein METZ01_LOCUS105431, partial [marine metagenome]